MPTLREKFWLSSYVSVSIAKEFEQRSRRGLVGSKKNENRDKIYLHSVDSFAQNSYAMKNCLVLKNNKDIAEDLLIDIYECSFEESSIFEPSLSTPIIDGDIEKLMKINLKYHSFEVFNKMMHLTNSSFGVVRDYLLIAALVHDFGKSQKVCQRYEIFDKKKPHHKKSADILRKIFQKNSGFMQSDEIVYFENLIDAVNIHHDGKIVDEEISAKKKKLQDSGGYVIDEKRLRNFFLEFLKKADTKQRKHEILYFDTLEKYCFVKEIKE